MLSQKKSGETSAYVTFFTREKGVISALCRGGHTPKKQALLQAFQPLWIELNQRHERHYVQSIEATCASYWFQGVALPCAWYVNELLYVTHYPNHPDEILYEAYEATLRALIVTQDRFDFERALRRFESVLLHSLGQSLSWTHDVHGAPMDPSKQYVFLATEGFEIAERGFLGSQLQAIAADQLHDPGVLASAKNIFRQAIASVLDGRVLKTRHLFKTWTLNKPQSNPSPPEPEKSDS